MVVAIDVCRGVGVANDAEHMDSRRRGKAIGVGNRLQGGGASGEDEVVVRAGDVFGDGIQDGHIALRIKMPHRDALAVLVTPIRERR